MYGGFQEECKSISWFENPGGHYSRRLFLLTLYFSLFLFFVLLYLPTSLHKFIQWTKESLERTTKSKFGRSEHCTMQHDEKGKWVNKYIGERKETLIDASRRKTRGIVYTFLTLCCPFSTNFISLQRVSSYYLCHLPEFIDSVHQLQ